VYFSVEERVHVYDWVWTPGCGLNLTRADIVHVGAVRLLKTDMLTYFALPSSVDPAGALRTCNDQPSRVVKKQKYGSKEIHHWKDILFQAKGVVNVAGISTLFMKVMFPPAPTTAVSVTLSHVP
jgi:hypothetical protein